MLLWCCKKYWIQIHLMLFFIKWSRRCPVTTGNSNTSHVILYPSSALIASISSVFKYISCYSLSLRVGVLLCYWDIQIHLMLFFIWSGLLHTARHSSDSNTSHVILYRASPSRYLILTFNSNTSHVILYRSQWLRIMRCWMNSNTSHVILYLLYAQRLNNLWRNSNTSHVILYHSRSYFSPDVIFIQIHLMLFFIPTALSCASWGWKIQIHLMLFFIASAFMRKTRHH